MKTKYHFKKSIFSYTYKFYDAEKEIGFIKKSLLTTTAVAELNGKIIFNREKRFFDKLTKIIDSDNKIIGKINYSTWNRKAFLKLYENKISWQYTNAWNTRWNIEIPDEKNIEFCSNGNIMTDTIIDNEIEILSAIYIYNHYQKAISVFFIILGPTFFTNIFKLLNS